MGPTYLLGDAGNRINLQSCRFNHANPSLENRGHLPSHHIWNSCEVIDGGGGVSHIDISIPTSRSSTCHPIVYIRYSSNGC